MATKARSLKERFEEHFLPEPNSGCWLWTGAVNNFGYGNFGIPRSGRKWKTAVASRASWMIYRGNIPHGMLVCHKCDVPSCVNPDHLFIGATKDNVADKCAKGRAKGGAPYGDANPASKLNDACVRDIRTRSMPMAAYARKYKVSENAVRAITHGITWKHVV